MIWAWNMASKKTIRCVSVSIVFYSVCSFIVIGIYLNIPSSARTKLERNIIQYFPNDRPGLNARQQAETIIKDFSLSESDSKSKVRRSESGLSPKDGLSDKNSRPKRSERGLIPEDGLSDKNARPNRSDSGLSPKDGLSDKNPSPKSGFPKNDLGLNPTNNDSIRDPTPASEPGLKGPVQDFHPFHSNRSFVYSAYSNVRGRDEVTVLAIVSKKAMTRPDAKPLSCVYEGGGGGARIVVRGRLTIFPDSHGLDMSAAYIICPLTKSLKGVRSSPLMLSMFTPRDMQSQRLILDAVPVQPPRPRKFQFLMCFSPLHGNYDRAMEIVENLELAQEMGADHAVVYNTSIGPNAARVLRYYASKGFLEIKSWRDPPEPVHYKGQMAANNDCLLQNTNRSEFIIFMDFDEMIVPRVHGTWSGLIRDLLGGEASSSDFVKRGNMLQMSEPFISRLLTKKEKLPNSPHGRAFLSSDLSNGDRIGAVSFISSVFMWGKSANLSKEDSQFAYKYRLPFLMHLHRTKQIWEKRCKNIVNPRTVNILGIHRVISFLGKQTSLLVNERIALLHHYRWYSNVPNVEDINMLRFTPTLVRRMKKTLKDMSLL